MGDKFAGTNSVLIITARDFLEGLVLSGPEVSCFKDV